MDESLLEAYPGGMLVRPAFAGMARFIDLNLRLQRIVRRASVPGRDHYENDGEHSFILSTAAVYLAVLGADKFEDIDLLKVVVYALFHDLVEVYAGDVVWGDPTHNKSEAEHSALLQIEEEFPEFPELGRWIRAYEKLEDQESVLVKGLDKIAATIVIYLSGGRSWREHGQTQKFIMDTLLEKIGELPDIPLLGELLMDLLSLLNLHPEMFAPATD
ncbi:MAG: metal dependent phosphohydrolase, putative hydrolase of superfamily [Patescibacteria group bacterium]|nr:metal dependent phosphohydrolase, putative hydrolase of superfamily [Patescibacteria group bacterium]